MKVALNELYNLSIAVQCCFKYVLQKAVNRRIFLTSRIIEGARSSVAAMSITPGSPGAGVRRSPVIHSPPPLGHAACCVDTLRAVWTPGRSASVWREEGELPVFDVLRVCSRAGHYRRSSLVGEFI